MEITALFTELILKWIMDNRMDTRIDNFENEASDFMKSICREYQKQFRYQAWERRFLIAAVVSLVGAKLFLEG